MADEETPGGKPTGPTFQRMGNNTPKRGKAFERRDATTDDVMGDDKTAKSIIQELREMNKLLKSGQKTSVEAMKDLKRAVVTGIGTNNQTSEVQNMLDMLRSSVFKTPMPENRNQNNQQQTSQQSSSSTPSAKAPYMRQGDGLHVTSDTAAMMASFRQMAIGLETTSHIGASAAASAARTDAAAANAAFNQPSGGGGGGGGGAPSISDTFVEARIYTGLQTVLERILPSARGRQQGTDVAQDIHGRFTRQIQDVGDNASQLGPVIDQLISEIHQQTKRMDAFAKVNFDRDMGGKLHASIMQMERFATTLEEGTSKHTDYVDAIEDAKKRLDEIGGVPGAITEILDSLKDGVSAQLIANVEKNLVNLTSTISDMVDSSKISRMISEEFSSSLEMNKLGMTSSFEGMTQGFTALFEARDNLKNTLNTVREAVHSGMINPIGIIGGNLKEVSSNLRETRLNLRGSTDVVSRMNSEDASGAITTLFAEQRAAGFRGEITDQKSLDLMSKQFEHMQLIAANTGMTVEQLVANGATERRTIANQMASGTLSEQMAQSLTSAVDTFASPSDGPFRDLINSIGESQGNFAVWANKNADLLQDLQVTGNVDELRAFMEAVTNNDGSDEDTNEMRRLASDFQVAMNSVHVDTLKSGDRLLNLMGAAGQVGQFQEPEEAGRLTKIATFLNDTFSNMIPPLLTAGVVSLGFNTAALWANTMALGGRGMLAGLLGGLGGKMGKLSGVFSGAVGKLTGAVTKLTGPLLKTGAGITTALASSKLGVTAATTVAGGLARSGLKNAGTGLRAAGGVAKIGAKAGASIGKSILKKIPFLGLLAGLGFGAKRLLDGDFAGAGMEVASGAMSMVPGVGTAASVGIDAALIARDINRHNNVGEAETDNQRFAPTSETVDEGATTNSIVDVLWVINQNIERFNMLSKGDLVEVLGNLSNVKSPEDTVARYSV